MFKRDYAEPDYTTKYFPKTDDVGFVQDILMQNGKCLQFAVLTQEDRENLNQQSTNLTIFNLMSLFCIALPPLCMNRISFFDRFRKTSRRVLIRTLMILIPLTLTGAIIERFRQENLSDIMNRYQLRYTDWKMNGDIRIFGPHVKISDSFSF